MLPLMLAYTLTVGIGIHQGHTMDPFGKNGAEQFSVLAPEGYGELSFGGWRIQSSGQLFRGSAVGSARSIVVHRSLGTLREIPVSVEVENSAVTISHRVTRIERSKLETKRVLRMTVGAVRFGSLALVGGYLANTYDGVLRLPEFVGSEPLALDSVIVLGGRIRPPDIFLGNRLTATSALRYLHAIGAHSSSTPHRELLGIIEITLHVHGTREHGWYISGSGQLASPRSPFSAMPSVGLRMMWKK